MPIPGVGGGRLPNILIIFAEKPYEIKEILVRGGWPGVPPKSATVKGNYTTIKVSERTLRDTFALLFFHDNYSLTLYQCFYQQFLSCKVEFCTLVSMFLSTIFIM